MGLFDNPVCETYRLDDLCGGYHGTFTLSYPSKEVCNILGLVNDGHVLIKHRT